MHEAQTQKPQKPKQIDLSRAETGINLDNQANAIAFVNA